MSREIKVYRNTYSAEDGGILIETLSEEIFDCEPDDVDEWDGTTAVDKAVEVLNLKIYAEEASSYPDWQRGTWYSRTEEIYDDSEVDTLEISAYLYGFDDTESLEIYKRFTSR